jgi:hypothetical protein
MLQIAVNFHTAFVDDSRLVLDKKRIRSHYLSTWFSVDAVGSFPGDTIFWLIEIAGGGVRAARTLPSPCARPRRPCVRLAELVLVACLAVLRAARCRAVTVRRAPPKLHRP